MTFDEWLHKEYEPADLQIKQYAERKEGLHIPATVYLEDLKKAFEAGQKDKVVEHFEAYGQCRDSRRIAELEAKIERMKLQYDYAFNQLCKSREILCSMLSQYRDTKEIDYSTRECGEKLLEEGVYKND